MSRSMFEIARRGALLALPAAGLLLGSEGLAQDAPRADARIVSHEVSISRGTAVLELELAGGRSVALGLFDGEARIDGQALGAAVPGGELDRSWRDLLARVIDSPADALPRLLRDWESTGEPGQALDRALEQAVAGIDIAPATPAPITDSLARLQERIAELEAQRAELEAGRADLEGMVIDIERGAERHQRWRPGPLHYVGRGLAGIFSVVMMFVVLFAIGIATIVFGGRKYLEGVADTARNATTRSFLVGIAGAFLTLPAFVLGVIALAVSIVGIPALLLWIPLFPLAVVAALALGYLAVAHATGEALAERRLYGGEWFKRGNSYYFLMTGLGLLVALFIGSAVVTMGGPWLGFIAGLLKFFAVMITWAALSIGFGAVLLSRAGTQPVRPGGQPSEPDLFTDTEEPGVA